MSIAENYTVEIVELQNEIKQIRKDYEDNDNAFFLCSMALIIFLMQCGFAFLEGGSVRSKNTTNILIKNLLDSCIAIIAYWSVGWAFAFGSSNNNIVGLFIGHTQFFLDGLTNYPKFFFQYVFAATSATIVSGAVAERCEFASYITYCSIITTFIYPILTHWGWHPQGWMHRGVQTDDIHTTYDLAGAGVVHLCGGTISFAAAYIIGPRIGRFPKINEEESPEIKGHSVPFAALGGFILMFGFLAFNGGSIADIVKPGEGEIVALAMVNTIISGAFAALTFLIIHFITKGKWTLLLTINACLAEKCMIENHRKKVIVVLLKSFRYCNASAYPLDNVDSMAPMW
ncbi:ammonium transporter [Dictyocaulus viviparus]|uniref:Ammonium transporter n=1 Tax=Dictyocaulus viviparus TaxID=29172 RepID=A0A0D8XB03_DICVI|nr:ammonium transporter [Dictyocaulus viviparus]